MTGVPTVGLLPGTLEHEPDVRSVSPTYLLSSSGPLMLRKQLFPSCPVLAATFLASEFATAFAISVFPQPGGP